MRFKTLRIILVVCFLILGLDLIYIQLLKGNYFYDLSVNNRIRVIPLEGQRGKIFDRNGLLLADSRLSFNVVVIPQDIVDYDLLFGYLSQALKEPKDKLLQRFHQRRYAPFAPVIIAEDIEKHLAMAMEENKFRFPGLYIQEDFRRWYPYGKSVSHVLGYVGKIDSQKIKKLKHYGYSRQSVIGYTGVEEYYDRYLIGKEGGKQIEVNSRGQQVRLLGVREPERGKNIQLTIDARIQEAALKALADRAGVVVMIDIDSGEVLCLLSAPSYDPNVFSDSKKGKERAQLFIDARSPMLNRTISGQYPPGSVFKTVIAFAGLMEKVINMNTIFHCPGYYKLGRRRFKCAHVHYDQNIVQAIGHSCNVYFYNVGLKLGPDTIHQYAQRFGLGELTHIDLPSEEKGFIPNSKRRIGKYNQGWYKGDTLNYSIGQGDVLATPVQITRMMATIASGGKVLQPHVLKGIGGESFVTTSVQKVLRLPKDVLNIVREGLRAAVIDHHGTARQVDLNGLEIYGKTGTAQTVPGKDTHAWFAGYNLQGKKRFAFCVFLEYGGSSYYAVRTTRDLLKALRAEDII